MTTTTQPRPTMKPEIVPHPAGGLTLAVPVGGGSTVRIYCGCWTPRRQRRAPIGRAVR